MIIHVSGSPGSGKTTLGNLIKKYYGTKIYIIDFDHIFKENDKNIKKYLNQVIRKCRDKPVIFIGLNYYEHKYYEILSDYKFYIYLPQNRILKQRFYRQVDKLQEDKRRLFNLWLSDPEIMQSHIINLHVNLEKWITDINFYDKLYEEKNYEFMSFKELKTHIKSILNNMV